MKNNFKIFIILAVINIYFIFQVEALETFIFDTKILNIYEEGNIISGNDGGKITTNNNKTIIDADNFTFNKSLNILNASGNVRITDLEKNYIILAPQITYEKNLEIIYSTGETQINFENKYNFISKNIFLDRNKMELKSSHKTKIIENNQVSYDLNKFKYLINKKILKGINVEVVEDINKDINNSDRYFFSDGIFDLENKNFKSRKTKIDLKQKKFNLNYNKSSDPRITGVSSSKEDNITIINKAIFTSCNKDEKCPPWSIKADKITHDSNKKKLIYDSAILRVYDIPIMYFPKFFHPDPSVERQSGFLPPRLNGSNILGSTITSPYFHIISDNKDLTFKPTFFENNTKMAQGEYRQVNENSNLLFDVGIVKNYKSSFLNTKKNIYHQFVKFNKDFKLENFNSSTFSFYYENINNDNYLPIFDGILLDSLLKPVNQNILRSGLDINLENEQYSFSTGFSSYEDLTKDKSDRFQFILPYYEYSNNLYSGNYGNINFSSNGNNNLNNTNVLKTSIINDVSYSSQERTSKQIGLVNNFEIYIKNINTIGKNDSNYSSSPKSDASTLFVVNTSIPLIKQSNIINQSLTPKASLRINPGNTLDYSNENRTINSSNIFSINRLGLSDTFEAGKSLTLGIDYRLENLKEINQYLDIKLGTVLRDKFENDIPKKSTINYKNSNLFGQIDYNHSEHINLNYLFSMDNNYQKFDSNNIGLNINTPNIIAKVNYIETIDELGNINVLENTFSYNFNEKNKISFGTRRNRTINLTEYYDLIYEYQNDCLTAGIKFKKTYYQDREIKPSEDLMLTFTIIPLTTLEQKLNNYINNN